jgi:hypothetical protein
MLNTGANLEDIMGIRFKGRFIPQGALKFANVPPAAPVFITDPSISPTTGISGETLFTGNDGVFTNGVVTSRQWLLNNIVVASGNTVTPLLPGTLVYRVTVVGNGGTVVANSAAVTVDPAPPPLFTVDPSITPSAGIVGVTTYTGNDGEFTGGTITARDWYVGTEFVGSGPTNIPQITGNLTYRVTVVGNGGTTIANSAPASVELPDPPVFIRTPSVTPTSGLMNATFTADPGEWTGATSVTREWLVNNRVLIGSNGLTVIPMKVGQLVYRVTLSNAAGTVVATSTPVTVNVNPAIAQPPTWITGSGYFGSFEEGSEFSELFNATDPNGGPLEYSIVSGTLPPGLSLNISTGELFGTIGAVEETTNFTFTLRVMDETNLTSDRQFEIQVQNVKSDVFWDTPEGSLGEPSAGSLFSTKLAARSV